MDKPTEPLIGLCILALVVIAFFAVFRGKGKLSIKTWFGRVKAEGENPPLPAFVPGGVRIEGAEAGGNVLANAQGAGGVDLKKVKAEGDIKATHAPGEPPPKT